ncbi:MAG: hypothetical protein ACLTDR_02660 [Adlercreutzia equolifaciens]
MCFVPATVALPECPTLSSSRRSSNALSDDDAGFSSAPSDGEVILLGDVLATIETSDLLRRVPGVRERFWDMFVVDAFIKNPDRNNGNWGALATAPTGPCRVGAPKSTTRAVRAFGKRSPSGGNGSGPVGWAMREPGAGRRLPRDGRLVLSAFGRRSAAALRFTPFEYMAKTTNPGSDGCAIKRCGGSAADMGAIDALIGQRRRKPTVSCCCSESMPPEESTKRLHGENVSKRLFFRFCE